MKVTDDLPVFGKLYISLNDEQVYVSENLVVTSGMNWIAQRIAGSTSPAPNDMDYMALGQNTQATQLEDIALKEEIARAQMSAVPQVTSNRVTFISTFVEGIGTGAITEAGIFDSATNGVMLSRSVFPVVNKQVDDYMTILWVISVGTPL